MRMDFTTCTVAAEGRADVLRRTYHSFRQNLMGVEWEATTGHVNVDGPMRVASHVSGLLDIVGQLTINVSDAECFPAAVRWCWQQPQTEYFFHLEDDWTLEESVSVSVLVGLMELNPTISCINLRAYAGINDTRICLSPGLWRTEHARIIAERLTDIEDPELQLRMGAQGPFIGMQWPREPRVIVKDIGREWRASAGLRKNRHSGKRLTAWEAVG